MLGVKMGGDWRAGDDVHLAAGLPIFRSLTTPGLRVATAVLAASAPHQCPARSEPATVSKIS
jgi:hypothetical protein